MDFFSGFDPNKMKPYLKMATQRINITVNKKSAQLKHQKREIANLLGERKVEKATIKVEHIIREDFMIESYELIELLCELLHERVRYMASNKDCPPDLLQAVCSIIWATSRVEISELAEVKKQLIKKYGSKFALAAEANENNCVNERLFAKLSVQPPSQFLVQRYLEELAKEFNVEWTPTDFADVAGGVDLALPISSPQGFSIPMAPGTQLGSAYQRPPLGSAAAQQTLALHGSSHIVPSEPEFFPPPPSYAEAMASGSNVAPLPTNSITQPVIVPPVIPSAPASDAAPADDDMSFEALQARFAALQKR